MLQKYSAESAGQPALEITPSAGFPPRGGRVEAGRHASGPHTLLFWENQRLPLCGGRGSTDTHTHTPRSCWRAVGLRTGPRLSLHPRTRSCASSSAPGLRKRLDPRPWTPGDLFCCLHAVTLGTSVLSWHNGADCRRVYRAVRQQGDRADKVSAPRAALSGPWSLIPQDRPRVSLTDRWVPLSSLRPADL